MKYPYAEKGRARDGPYSQQRGRAALAMQAAEISAVTLELRMLTKAQADAIGRLRAQLARKSPR